MTDIHCSCWQTDFLNEAITGRILLGVLRLLIGAAVSLRKDKAQPVLD